MTTHFNAGWFIALTVLFAGYASHASGQTRVTREAELSASIFFGNTSQRLAAARFGVARADSGLELALGARYTYADVESDAGIRAVNRRSWDATASADWRPYARVTPFVFANVESSLEKQIDFRYGFGAGGKLVFGRDSVFEHSLSAAILGEKTTPRVETPGFNDELLARWSVRHRLKGKLSPAVSYTSTTLYKPAFSDMGDYTVSSVNSLAVALSTILSLSVSFIDTYDSEARLRGAESNNDGQLLFGLRAAW
jgi:hypothetical protein